MPACAESGRATHPTALPIELTTQVSTVEVPGVEPDPSPYQGAAQTAMLHLGASLGTRTRHLPLTRRVLIRLSLRGISTKPYPQPDSNRRPSASEAAALSTELQGCVVCSTVQLSMICSRTGGRDRTSGQTILESAHGEQRKPPWSVIRRAAPWYDITMSRWGALSVQPPVGATDG
jgi:hypothetical protein